MTNAAPPPGGEEAGAEPLSARSQAAGRDRPRHLSSSQTGLAATRASHARKAEGRGARRRGPYRLLGIVSACTVILVLSLTLSSGTTNQGSIVNSRSSSKTTVAEPRLHASLAGSWSMPGKPSTIPLPKRGQGAVEVAGLGLVAATGHQRCVPIASVTKIMTAYLVLKDHPLTGDSGGPVFTMTGADHKAWVAAVENDDSNLEVVAGERLDERQLLQALLIPSADNIANYLAAWDAGSVPAFVRKMNAEAASLGLGCTHYADPSGVNPLSRSSAVYQAKLAGMAMQNPVLQSITDELGVRLPVAGEIWNIYDPAVGADGIIGVKSGFTSEAQICLVTAAWRALAGHRVLVVSAVLGQPLSLYGAADEDEAMLDAVTKELRVATLLPASAVVGTATVGWDKTAVAVRLGPQPFTVIGWPGLALRPLVVPVRLRPSGASGWAAGLAAATVEVEGGLGTCSRKPAMLSRSIPAPPDGWAADTDLPG